MNLELKNDCFELHLKMDGCCQGGGLSGTEKVDPANPENPFDEIGVAHNAGLDHIASRFADQRIVIEDDIMISGYVFEDDVILRASIEFLSSYPFKNSAINDVLQSKKALFIKEIGQWDPRPGDIPFSSEFPVDTIVAIHDWLERLKYAEVPADIFGQGLAALQRGQVSAGTFIKQIKRLEAAAAASELSEDDKFRVYATGSIARHSAEYWANSVSAAKAGGPIGSDVKGAASGAAAGFITGVGILVGGLVGGLTRSAAYLLADKVAHA